MSFVYGCPKVSLLKTHERLDEIIRKDYTSNFHHQKFQKLRLKSKRLNKQKDKLNNLNNNSEKKDSKNFFMRIGWRNMTQINFDVN